MEIELSFDQEEEVMRQGLRDAMTSLKENIDAVLEMDELSDVDKENLATDCMYLSALKQTYQYYSVQTEWEEMEEEFAVDNDEVFHLLTGWTLEEAIDQALTGFFNEEEYEGLREFTVTTDGYFDFGDQSDCHGEPGIDCAVHPMTEANQVPVVDSDTKDLLISENDL